MLPVWCAVRTASMSLEGAALSAGSRSASRRTSAPAGRERTAQMQKGDVIRARFMTLPDLFPGKGWEEKKFPIRKGTVVYVHPKGRYIVAECGGVRETFFPEEVVG